MPIITVPVINQYPDKITVNYQTNYAVSPETSNPYMLGGFPTGVTGLTGTFGITGVQPGGAGVLGGPEYVNLLQRTAPSTVQLGYGAEQFQLAAYPNYTFYSFDNFTTGQKNVVAFDNTVPNMPAFAPITLSSYTHGTSGATASYPMLASGGTAVTYTWSGSAIGTGLTGQGTNSINFAVTGTTGPATLIVTVTEGGNSITSTQTVTIA